MFLWLGVSPAEPSPTPNILMAAVGRQRGGVYFRPLLALSREHAEELRPLAAEAADDLGVQAVLQEYRACQILGIEPATPADPTMKET